MDEQTETKESEEKSPAENTGEGDKPEAINPLDRADAQIKRMAELDTSLGEKIQKLSDIEARRILGGRADAGQGPAPKAVETPEEYAERFKRGEVNPLEDDGVKA